MRALWLRFVGGWVWGGRLGTWVWSTKGLTGTNRGQTVWKNSREYSAPSARFMFRDFYQ